MGAAHAEDTPSDAELISAVERGSAPLVRQLLDAGANPNARDVHGDPALTAALHGNQFEVAAVLVTAPGVDLDQENQHGQTALMVAAFEGRLELVRSLVNAGAEVQHSGWTALHYAATTGRAKVVRLLLDSGAYIDAESPNRTTPLMLAARIKDRVVCQLLVDENADPTPRNDAGLDAAAFAQKAGDTELAAWFSRQVSSWQSRHPASAPAPVLEPEPAAPAPAPGEQDARPPGTSAAPS